MPVIIPPGFAQVVQTLRLTGDPDPHMITYAVSITSPGSVTMANALKTAFESAWDTNLRDNWATSRLILRVGQDGADPVVFESTSADNAGGSTSDGLPSNCALLIRKLTGAGGRRNRGRMYFPGVLSDTSTDELGAIQSATVAVLQSAADTWFGLVNAVADVTDMVLLHGSGSPTPTVITSLQVQSVIATQRRRMRP